MDFFQVNNILIPISK